MSLLEISSKKKLLIATYIRIYATNTNVKGLIFLYVTIEANTAAARI